MAVIDQVTPPLTHPQPTSQTRGSRTLSLQKVITKGASDNDGSKYLIGEIPDTAIIERIELEGAAITGATDYDIGLYNPDGSVAKKDCFADGLNLSNATGIPLGRLGLPMWGGMASVTQANSQKLAYEHALHVNKTVPAGGEIQKKPIYKVVLTANTAGGGAGTLVARVSYRICA